MKLANFFDSISIESGENGWSLVEPSLIGTSKRGEYISFNKRVYRYLYGEIGLKGKLSSDLYNMDEELWKTIIKSKISNHDPEFSFENYEFISINGMLIEMTQTFDKELFNSNIMKLLSNDLVNSSECIKNYNGTFVCPVVKDNVVIILTLDVVNGWYTIHSGIIDKLGSYNVFLKPYSETSSIVEFIDLLNIDSVITETKDLTDSIVCYDNSIQLSLREILDIIKMSGIIFELDDDKMVSSAIGIDTESSNEIVSFINDFGLTYKSLKKSNYLWRHFKISRTITNDEMRNILSKNLLSESCGITGYTIASLNTIDYTDQFDKCIIERENK